MPAMAAPPAIAARGLEKRYGAVTALAGVDLEVAPGEAAYVPLAHDYPGAPTQLPLQAVLERLRPWLEDATAPKCGQHVKYDQHVLANHGITVRGYVHDTLLQSYVLEVHKPHNLESLAERHLGRRGLSYEDLCGKGAAQIPFAQVALERAAPYACEDAEMCLAVHQVLCGSCRPSQRCAASTNWRWPSPRCFFAWNGTAC
jgi:DNA polymerase-1